MEVVDSRRAPLGELERVSTTGFGQHVGDTYRVEKVVYPLLSSLVDVGTEITQEGQELGVLGCGTSNVRQKVGRGGPDSLLQTVLAGLGIDAGVELVQAALAVWLLAAASDFALSTAVARPISAGGLWFASG